jgi:hypothetical protein
VTHIHAQRPVVTVTDGMAAEKVAAEQ